MTNSINKHLSLQFPKHDTTRTSKLENLLNVFAKPNQSQIFIL